MLPRPVRLASAGLAFLAPALVLITTSADSRQINDVASYILSRQSAPATLDAGALARSTILWVSAGVLAMLVLTYLLSRHNMRWIERRAVERRQP
jgi:hypothetical protein